MKRLTDEVLVAIVLALCVLTLWTGPVVAIALFFLVGPVLVVCVVLEHNARGLETRPRHHGPASGPRRRHDPPQSV